MGIVRKKTCYKWNALTVNVAMVMYKLFLCHLLAVLKTQRMQSF